MEAYKKYWPKEVVQFDKQAEEAMEKGAYRVARDFYSKAINLLPSDPYLYTKRGVATLKLGDLEGTYKEYQKAIELDPNFALAYSLMGTILIHMERNDEAETCLKKAIALNPDDKNSQVLLTGMKNSQESWERIAKAAETLRMILTYETAPAQFEKILGRLDTDLLALVKANADTAKKDGDGKLGEALENLARFIDSIIAIRILVGEES